MTSSVETTNGARAQSQSGVEAALAELVAGLQGLAVRTEAIERQLAATTDRLAPIPALPPARIQGPACSHGAFAQARATARRA